MQSWISISWHSMKKEISQILHFCFFICIPSPPCNFSNLFPQKNSAFLQSVISKTKQTGNFIQEQVNFPKLHTREVACGHLWKWSYVKILEAYGHIILPKTMSLIPCFVKVYHSYNGQNTKITLSSIICNTTFIDTCLQHQYKQIISFTGIICNLISDKKHKK